MENKVINGTQKIIGTTASVISQPVFNGQRAVLALTNISTAGQVISVGVLSQAKAGQGIVLQPLDRYVESQDAGYSPSNEQVTAISSGAGGVLAIQEVIELE